MIRATRRTSSGSRSPGSTPPTIGKAESRLRAGSDHPDGTALAGAVQQAVAEAFNPTPHEVQPGFPVQDFMRAVLRGADELGIDLSRDEILDIFEAALRRNASMVIGDQIRGVLAGPFGPQELPVGGEDT